MISMFLTSGMYLSFCFLCPVGISGGVHSHASCSFLCSVFIVSNVCYHGYNHYSHDCCVFQYIISPHNCYHGPLLDGAPVTSGQSDVVLLLWCMLSASRYHAGCYIHLWGLNYWVLHHYSPLELTCARHMCNLVMVISQHQECSEWLLPPLL